MLQFKQTLAPFFPVVFDAETHTYTANNETLTSVTTLIKTVTPEFNSHMISNVVAKNSNLPAEYYREYWRYNAEWRKYKGLMLHLYASQYPNLPAPKCAEEQAILSFYRTLKGTVLNQELPMCYRKLAGTADLIVLLEDNTLAIYDWKMTEDLYKANGKLLLPDEPKNTPYNKYSIQLSLYKEIIERATPFKVSKLVILQFGEEITETEIIYNKNAIFLLNNLHKENN